MDGDGYNAGDVGDPWKGTAACPTTELPENLPLLHDQDDDNVFVPAGEDAIPSQSCNQAAIISQLPSHRLLSSDHGYTLSRTLARTRRRKKRGQSFQSQGQMEDSFALPVSTDMVDAEIDLDVSANNTALRRSGSKKSEDLLDLYREENIRSMTSSLSVKRRYRHQQSEYSFHSLKRQGKKTWLQYKAQMKGWMYQLEPWAGTLKEIEGRFGSATVSYFTFVRWLLMLNLVIFLIMFLVIFVPHVGLPDPQTFSSGLGINESYVPSQEARDCSLEYAAFIENQTIARTTTDKFLDFIQGTGWMERTHLFYGYYFNKTFPSPENNHTYNMSLAYLLATGLSFLLSFFLIIRSSANTVKEGVMNQESSTLNFVNKVFCGWDFCIANPKSSRRKQNSLLYELTSDLEEQRRANMRSQRTTSDKCKLYLIRILINLFVLGILGGTLYLIYWTTSKLRDLQGTNLSEFLALLVQFLPSLTITVLNFIIPQVFAKIVLPEDYSPSFELKITLVRTVLLRLASLAVLLVSLYLQLVAGSGSCDIKGLNNKCCGNRQWSSVGKTRIMCWETYVGQQLYKLVLLDFIAVFVLTFFMEFPRNFVVQRYSRFKVINMIGRQEFDLPVCVLDIVYTQTLCWVGMIFSPMIPAMTLVKVFLVFYMKKLTLLKNCIPPARAYRASRSKSFFMIMLLLSFVLAALPIGYMVGNIPPSKSCGPFRVYGGGGYVMFSVISFTIMTWPTVARDIFLFLGTVGFFVPAIILLCLLMYYFWASSEGYKKKEKILQEQLRLEGKDRQFLLARVNEIPRGELGNAAGAMMT